VHFAGDDRVRPVSRLVLSRGSAAPVVCTGLGTANVERDARRKGLRDASDRLGQAWAQLASQTSVIPVRAHPALHGEGLPSYVLDWLDHDAPGEYWSSLDVSRRLDKILVPALHISGWYDMFLRGSVDGFLALSKSAGSDFARENQYLLAGPWVHIPWGDRIGTADFGHEALIDTDAILLRWFDQWLKDSGTFEGEPQVCHFVLGENRWREAEAFPTEAEHTLFLHSEGRANSRKGNGTLSTVSPSAGEPCDIFVHDPEVPVIAPGGPAAASGLFDQAALELGNNLLVYSTEPLEKPLWVFGIPRAVLYCSTSQETADFTAKLVRVKPNGAAEFICIGVARSGRLFAEGNYAADRIQRWDFPLEPTSCRFARGERIRLEISSSAFPLIDRNPGSGGPSCRATSWDWQRSTQFVFHGPERASALYLPASEAPE